MLYSRSLNLSFFWRRVYLKTKSIIMGNDQLCAFSDRLMFILQGTREWAIILQYAQKHFPSMQLGLGHYNSLCYFTRVKHDGNGRWVHSDIFLVIKQVVTKITVFSFYQESIDFVQGLLYSISASINKVGLCKGWTKG